MPLASLLARLLRDSGVVAVLTLCSLAVQPAWAGPSCLAASAQNAPSIQDRAFAQALFDYVEGRWPQAQRQFEALARQGHAAAQYNLAVMHARAEARPSSEQAAQQGFERAAECGFVTAMFALGEWFDSPQRGGQRQRALQWYVKAAEVGSVDGQRQRPPLT